MNWLLKTYIYVLLVIFGGIVFHAPLSVWLGVQMPEYDLVVKSWKEILLVALFPLGVFLAWKKGILRQILHDKLFFMIAVYAVLHILLVFVFRPEFLSLISGLMIDLRYLLFFTLVYVALRLAPRYTWYFLWVGIGAATAALLFALLQVFILPADFLTVLGYSRDTIASHLLVDDNPDFVRINSTLRGPNPLGAYVVIILSLLAAFVLRGRLKTYTWWQVTLAILLGVGSVVALWASYSRSALVAAVVAVGLVAVIVLARKVPFKVWGIAAVAILFVLSAGIYLARDTDTVQNVILHDDPETNSAVSSNEEHAESLQVGVERMLTQPLGAGPGSTGSASLYGNEPLIIENQYLFVAHESGWPGIVLFVAIFGLVLWRLWRQPRTWLSIGVFASGVGLAAIGLLQPVWVDDTVSLVWWGLAAIVLAVPAKRVTKRLASRQG